MGLSPTTSEICWRTGCSADSNVNGNEGGAHTELEPNYLKRCGGSWLFFSGQLCKEEDWPRREWTLAILDWETSCSGELRMFPHICLQRNDRVDKRDRQSCASCSWSTWSGERLATSSLNWRNSSAQRLKMKSLNDTDALLSATISSPFSSTEWAGLWRLKPYFGNRIPTSSRSFRKRESGANSISLYAAAIDLPVWYELTRRKTMWSTARRTNELCQKPNLGRFSK